jgi:hypothetical protein
MTTLTTVEELDAAIKTLQEDREKLLEASKVADLETVKKLCKQHGFTATQLRGVLKTRGRSKKDDGSAAETKSTAVKSATGAKKKSGSSVDSA